MSVWRTISIALQADTRGYTRDLKGASDATAALGDSVEKNIGGASGEFRTFSDRARSAWNTMKGWGQKLGGIAGGFGLVATATKALTGGWRRVTTLQDATSALTVSLGDASAAAKVMDDVLNVVTGTPYNFDAFAASAQEMIGMGIEAQKVPTYLEAIGEAAATQGGRAQEFADRLSTSFGQIASSGQISLRDVWSISQTGVNALAILANSFGVTREEMKKMVSQGAVPAEQALDALAKGILHGTDGAAGATRALAGTMETLRENMSGAVGGVSSALDRLGAAFIEMFSPLIVAGAVALTDAIDDIAGALSNIGEVIAPVIEGFLTIGGTVVLGALGGVAKAVGAVAGFAGQSETAIRLLTAAMVAFTAQKILSGVGALVDSMRTYYGVIKAEAAVKGVSTMRHGMSTLGGSALKSAGGFAALTGAVALGTYAWQQWREPAERAKRNLDSLTSAALESGDAMSALRDKLALTWAGADGGFESGAWIDLKWAMEEIGVTVGDLGTALEEGGDSLAHIQRMLVDEFGPAGAGLARDLQRWHDNGQKAAGTTDDMADATRELAWTLEAASDPMERVIAHLWTIFKQLGMSPEEFEKFVAGGKKLAGVESAADNTAAAISGLPPQILAMSDAFDDLAESIDNSVDRLSAWADLYAAVVGIPKAWEDANREWIGTLHDLEEALKESGGNIDIHTEAGRENLKMVSDAIDDGYALAEAFGEQGNGAEDAATMLAFMREQLILTITQQVGSREAAEKLVAQYGLTEEAMWLLSEAAKTGSFTAGQLAGVMEYLAEKGGEAKLKIDEAGQAVMQLPNGKTVTIDVFVRRQALNQALHDIERVSGKPLSHWTGGGGGERWGGVHRYAKGGIHGRQAMVGSGKNMVWWDEPETGGEAYIPRLGDPNRSIPVLRESASWYGMGIVPMRDGGIRAPMGGGYRPGGTGRVTHFHGGINITEQQLGVTRGEVVDLARQAIRDELRNQR